MSLRRPLYNQDVRNPLGTPLRVLVYICIHIKTSPSLLGDVNTLDLYHPLFLFKDGQVEEKEPETEKADETEKPEAGVQNSPELGCKSSDMMMYI